MRFLDFITVFCFFVLLTSSAANAEIYNNPKSKDGSAPSSSLYAPTPKTIPPVPQPAPSAAEPEENIHTFAEQYYQNCLQKDDPVLKGESLKALCQCSAQKIPDVMTVKQVKQMQEETAEGQLQRNRMAIHVYAPCMKHPTQAMLLNNCNANKAALKDYPNGGAICTCMADKVADYVAENGPAVMAQKLSENPYDNDPLGGFMASQQFQMQAQAAFMACIQLHNPMKR